MVRGVVVVPGLCGCVGVFLRCDFGGCFCGSSRARAIPTISGKPNNSIIVFIFFEINLREKFLRLFRLFLRLFPFLRLWSDRVKLAPFPIAFRTLLAITLLVCFDRFWGLITPIGAL